MSITETTRSMDGIEIYDPDVYVAGVPHEDFAKLRADAPVSFQPENGIIYGGLKGPGFWAITKYDDIVAVSRNPQVFSSWLGGTNVPDQEEMDLEYIRMLVVNMDPPQHTKFRALVRKGFAPRQVQKMKDGSNGWVTQTLDAAPVNETIDFVKTVAAEVPLQILAEVMGIPQEDRGKIFDWSNRLIGFDDPEFQTSMEDAREAAAEVWFYANERAEERRGTDATDLISLLVNGTVDGEPMTEMEFDAFFLMLCVAGNETTRNTLSGGLLALLEHPDQMARLWNDPSLVDSAVEEMLRWVTPVMHFRRTTTEDTVIRGTHIPKGDKVVMFYSSGNRDEEHFPDPFKFDIGRTPNYHLAFGNGEHFCLGAHLARLELRLTVKQMVERYSKIELMGEPRRLRSNFINGIKELPVKLTPR
ncbi:MAG: cholest-4-en-3-one 26-monooxygenase [Myxococcota bacterium]|jgi:cholest-4-en-3-one 26-monooxygenase